MGIALHAFAPSLIAWGGSAFDADEPEKSISVTESSIGDSVFTRSGVGIQMRVPARRLPSWRAEGGAADPLPQSPVEIESFQESISLLPYAAAKLRITAFAKCKT